MVPRNSQDPSCTQKPTGIYYSIFTNNICPDYYCKYPRHRFSVEQAPKGIPRLIWLFRPIIRLLRILSLNDRTRQIQDRILKCRIRPIEDRPRPIKDRNRPIRYRIRPVKDRPRPIRVRNRPIKGQLRSSKTGLDRSRRSNSTKIE